MVAEGREGVKESGDRDIGDRVIGTLEIVILSGAKKLLC